MAIKIMAYNSKGGVGKTTTIWALGSGLAMAGQKTLIVDLDFQGHQARSFGLEKGDNMERLVRGKSPIEDVIVEARENLDLVPADFGLSDVWQDANKGFPSDELSRIESEYKFILFDTNPGMNALTKEAAKYIDFIIAPVNLEFLAVDGIVTFEKLMRSVDRKFDQRLLGVIPCRHDLRGKRSLEVLDAIKTRYRDNISPPVRVNNTIDKAQNVGETIFEHDPTCNGAEDYFEVTKWVISRVKEKTKTHKS